MDTIIAAVITAVITGLVTLAGVLISNGKSQAITDTKLEELTREVREHNQFAKRMPVLEEKVSKLEDDVKELKKDA